jgi:hypothetical protein
MHQSNPSVPIPRATSGAFELKLFPGGAAFEIKDLEITDNLIII